MPTASAWRSTLTQPTQIKSSQMGDPWPTEPGFTVLVYRFSNFLWQSPEGQGLSATKQASTGNREFLWFLVSI